MARVIALGFFDGVHLGHGALLSKTAEIASALGLTPSVMTFDRSPGKDGLLLSSVADRILLIRTLYGIEEVQVLPFTESFMHMPWDEYLALLVRDYDASHLVCGYDYRFGYRGAGDPALLGAWCRDHGLGFDVVPQCTLEGTVISSTYLRELITAGDGGRATRFYGHRHLLSGTVTTGRHLGHTLGFPTANLEPDATICLPKDGVYAVLAETGGARYVGVCNVGSRPTVGGHHRRVETWLDGFEGDLYGKPLSIWFDAYLRPERTFPDLESLRKEIFRNRDQARLALRAFCTKAP